MNSTSPAARFVTMPTRSPGFSIAGPDVARTCTPISLRDHVRERRLAEARRAVQQHVIERLAALLRRGDRHLQVLADAVLADVLVEHARTQPGFVLRVLVDARRGDDRGQLRSRSTRGSGSLRQLPQRLLQRPFEAAVGRRLDRSIDSFFGERPMIPQVHERREHIVAQRGRLAGAVAGGRGRGLQRAAVDPSARATMRSDVFLPTPGIAVSRATSPRSIARTSSCGSMPDSTASASFGPMPLTPISRSNRSSSSSVANPYSASASSRTWV